MKCEVHPDQEAIGTCVSCHRGICPICKVVFQERLYCKGCIEGGRIIGTNGYGGYPNYPSPSIPPGYPPAQYPQHQYLTGGPVPYVPNPYSYPNQYQYPYQYPYPPPHIPDQPTPHGVPNKAFNRLGLAGACVSGAIIPVFGILSFLMGTLVIPWHSSLVLVLTLLVAAGYILLSMGIFGFHRNLGSVFGIYGSIGLIAVAIIFIFPPVYLTVMVAVYGGLFHGSAPISPILLYYLTALICGFGGILTAVALLLINRYLKIVTYSKTASILLFISCGGLAAFIGVFYWGWVLAGLGFFFTAPVFLHAPLPGDEHDPLSQSGPGHEVLAIPDERVDMVEPPSQ